MTDRPLNNCRILVVEDEYVLAEELAYELGDAGAVVLGPVSTIERALILLRDQAPPDGAILDVNLGGVPVYPLADTLTARRVPFVFTTGYDAAGLPERFAHIAKCEKPFSVANLTAVVARAIHA